MMKNKKMVKGIALGAMIAALAAGGTAAYLTDFETATNSFTVRKSRYCFGRTWMETGRKHQDCTYSGNQKRSLCGKQRSK